ncbi:pitrilysin family protein [Sinorhizobium sp. 7-81]|uniref:M16 family metallopeptidase n=1 Tax=unclassified Sinorhizobium TaxID=2613772 RepID=UPI0024C28978|nr:MULTISPECIES: pitrilysin family protein [unclassified Sinorhizobium]MDK1389262.1 pitrilysin family protein [Sinorhizobium sp. 7-81]MDK1493542.1 pitrilysin family protein [Sinorhizobium sp. 8-89]
MTIFNRLPVGAAKPLLVVLVLMGLSATPARAAKAIQEVTTSTGITAWLVEDYSLPIVSIRFAFRGGSTQDPSGKEGIVNLMTSLLDEGAGELDSEAFQERLDDAGAATRFWAGSDAVYGSMRVLADQKDDAFDLLRRAIEQPRFDQEPLDRIRGQIGSGIRSQAKDPETAAEVAWSKAIYGDHPYSRPYEGTEQTLAAVTTSDLRTLHKRLFARGNLSIAVAGAINADTLKRDLDRIFGGLPAEPSLVPIPEAEPKLGQEILTPFYLAQTRLSLTYPGLSHKDAHFFAAYLMNNILGGSVSTSRLWNAVREKRGLAYDIHSILDNRDYASTLVIGTGTRPDRAAEVLSLIRGEVRRMTDEGVSEKELEAAKKEAIGSYAIASLNSLSAITHTLLEIQMEDLGIDYIERRKQLIQAVTVDDVRSAARRLLSTDPAVLILGAPLEERRG